MKNRTFILPLLWIFTLFSFTGCTIDSYDTKSNIIQKYENDEISNVQMLLLLGEHFDENQSDVQLLKEYCYRLVYSGYGTKVLANIYQGYFDADEQTLKGIVDMAIEKGGGYELASIFANSEKDTKELFEPFTWVYDSLQVINKHIKRQDSINALTNRGIFLSKYYNEAFGLYDFNKVLTYDPCLRNALFHKSLIHFKRAEYSKISDSFSKCNYNDKDSLDWSIVFPMVADSLIQLQETDLSVREIKFKSANVLLTFNLLEPALNIADELILEYPDNADYHAFEAFVYYRLGNKDQALKSLTTAEKLSGRKNSILRKRIENLY